MTTSLPIAIIGAGPVGLAAAAHALSRGITPVVFEAGAAVGDGIRRWGHVRLFSPWRYNTDKEAARLLKANGWVAPNAEVFPTGNELVDQYLSPLARTPELAPHIRLQSRVVGVTRSGRDLMKDAGRDEAPFLVRVEGPDGEHELLAQAIIDASGTIDRPGTLGVHGLPALGERAAAERIFYGIPDVLGQLRPRYANRRVLVVGSGHSALNALLDLATLAEHESQTTIAWAVRRQTATQLFGGGSQDQLEARGRLGSDVRALIESGRVQLVTGFGVERVSREEDALMVSAGGRSIGPVDEIIAATGFRPEWSILSEVRLDIDPAVQSTRALAPLIDPNVHSCGTVRPHGAEELKQPESNLFVIGMKSYGRAPTFLLLTGYEQARSVVAAIAGDWDAARRVELELPKTGVCSTDRGTDAGSCCGPAEAVGVAVTTPLRTGKLLATITQQGTGCC